MSTQEPDGPRWRPLRAGLVDLFYYDTEEFHFHHGSLLLRGNNGTGKSKVLALTVPFLLDGELAPHRVEPDGDRNKRMEWNLLLGGKYPHPERLGYTWLEFGRRDAGGDTHFVTLGCGMKAATGRGIVRHWFFVTTRRVGHDLSLVTPTGTAITRERLREAIAERGLVYDRAVDYRRAVDEALFGLGPRYDALVSLLIQLRQPQLSKRPDERLLSAALTQALAPLDDNLIAQAAEAFRGLDDEREALIGLRETKNAADDFLTGYRRYAKVATKRTATGPRRTQATYEQVGRDLGEAEREFERAELELETARRRLEELEASRRRLADQRSALVESPEARAAENLEREARHAAGLTKVAAERRDIHQRAVTDRRKATERWERATAALAAATAGVQVARSEASEAASGARVGALHTANVDPAARGGETDLAAGTRGGEELAAWREQSLRSLTALLDTAGKATSRSRETRRGFDAVTSQLAAADERVASATTATARAGAGLVSDTRGFLSGTHELRVGEVESVLAALEPWVETLDGENPAETAITAAYRAAAEALARAKATVESTMEGERRCRDELREEIDRLAAGGQGAPPLPYTRRAVTRAGRPGAPLWRVVDFAPEVPSAERAGIEAALEAAGVLDAWLCPDGTVLDRETDDVIVSPAEPVPGPDLSGPLRPAIDPDDLHAGLLDERTVLRVLEAIGFGEGDSHGDAWITADGRFRFGVLTGQWRKGSAEYIGEGAREAARRARIVELRGELDLVDARLEALGARAAELGGRSERLNAEHDARPSDTPLREAHAATRGERANRARVSEAYDEASRALAEAIEAERGAVAAASEFAGDVDLPEDPAALAAVGRALGEYRVALVKLWAAVRTALAAARAAADTEPDVTETMEIEREAAERHAEAEEEAASARERHETLAATVGTAVAELRRRLAQTEDEIRVCDREIKRTRDDESRATGERGRAEGRRDTLRQRVQETATERDEAVEGFRTFAGTGLLTLACPDLDAPDPERPWAATPAVALARGVDRALDDIDDSDRRWELVQQSVTSGFKQLADGLSRHGHQAGMTARDGMLLVDVVFQGRTQPVAGLAEALDVEIGERQRILSAHEREVLETHLVNEVAGTLQELIVSAERQVAEMNRELQERPTSTGMRLRLVWRPSKSAPEGLAELRGRLLRQSSDVWSDDDRQRVGAFLSRQISAERLRDDAGTWHEQLARALDYRAWHEFAVQRYADGQWRPAAGPASGGERVLAASVPLFAAASSYYGSAGNPHAPRLIALDEAFAGVDDDSRAKCLGLLARFDLDVVMTSEREWGCYPEVPGLAIAQLSRREGIDAVLVTPWRWDGSGVRYQVPRPRPERGEDQAAALARTEQAGLFG